MFNYDKLEQAIKQSGKKKTYLCEKLGRPPYYLRDVIKQKNVIPDEYQTILADELGVTVEWLNDGDKKIPATKTDDGVDLERDEAIRLYQNAPQWLRDQILGLLKAEVSSREDSGKDPKER